MTPKLGLGFQSTQLQNGVNLLKEARSRGDKIVLAFTGNTISTGLREYVRLLAEQRLVSAFVTSGAGVEEDLIKTFGAYEEVGFTADPELLERRKLYRIGNLAVSHPIYEQFDEFLELNYVEVTRMNGCDQTPGEISRILGRMRGNKESYLYWADLNDVPVYCPTFHDGGIGDFLSRERAKGSAHRLDFVLENVKLSNQLEGYERCGIVILGGGTSKHFALNNSVARGGYDWSITITTATPYDGSDSGGDANEARSWGKMKADAPAVHILADSTIAFPILVEMGWL